MGEQPVWCGQFPVNGSHEVRASCKHRKNNLIMNHKVTTATLGGIPPRSFRKRCFKRFARVKMQQWLLLAAVTVRCSRCPVHKSKTRGSSCRQCSKACDNFTGVQLTKDQA